MAKNTDTTNAGQMTPEELAELENAAAAEAAALAQTGQAAAASGEEIEHTVDTVAAAAGRGDRLPSGWAYDPARGFFKYASIEKGTTTPQVVTAEGEEA